MATNNTKRKGDEMTVETYSFKDMRTGRTHVRWATKVVRSDGKELRFMEKLPKSVAIQQALCVKHEWAWRTPTDNKATQEK